jgi:4,5-DOPA dioxygenase extradiol
MPALFIGHGSPMNAIEKNEFSDSWLSIAQSIPKPKSILCISAHWETNGTAITAMSNPKTIHDFGGFPEELYEVQYPAPGNPELAEEIIRKVTKFKITPDFNWGFDHGSWSVIRCMYPNADIPLIQLSIDRTQPLSYHYELAKELLFLRDEQVLIIGSGNIVHNLRMIDWQNEGGAEWAKIANDKIKELIINNH